MAGQGQNRETTPQQTGSSDVHIAQRLPPLRRVTTADIRHVAELATRKR